MSNLHTFQRYATAVDALRSRFDSLGNNLFAKETITQYELSADMEGLAWLKGDLPALVDSLLPAGFRLTLIVTVHDFRAELEMHGDATHLQYDCRNAGFLEGISLDPLPSEVVDTFEALQDALREGATDLVLTHVCNLLEKLAAAHVGIRLSLRIFLDKTRISRRLVAHIGASERPKVVSFLFPEALVTALQRISLASFEKEFCQHGRRTVIIVFGFTGWLSSDVLVICGGGHERKLADLLSQPLSGETLQRVGKTLEFRQSQSSWAFPTTWLTPDTFALTTYLLDENDVGVKVSRQLKSFQALLSAIFLADSVEFRDGEHWVEYRGLGRTRFPVSRAALLGREVPCGEALYQLYAYAYDGFSADKLEITQQFLSLIAVNLTALCDRAAEIRDATKKTYDRALVERVKDYFDARHKIQERIKTAIAETSNSVISLTREVSADLYKIAGILVGAFVGALLKPDISSWAFLGASLVIAIYLSLVIFYYLATLKRTYQLRMNQHTGYIQSFRDVLRETEIDDFLSDEHLGKAQTVFSNKYKQARAIYIVFLIVALLLAVMSVLGLFGQFSVSSLSRSTSVPLS